MMMTASDIAERDIREDSRGFSAGEANTLLEIIADCTHISTRDEFERIFEKLRTVVPFQYGACGIITLQSSHFEVVHCSYPVEFANLYMAKGLETEPAILELRQTRSSLATSEDRPAVDRPEVDAIKSIFGIGTCVSLAMRGQLGFCLYVAVSNFAPEIKPKLIQVLRVLSSSLQHSCTRIAIPWDYELKEAEAIMKDLSEKQAEVLRWLFVGKTCPEIGLIMGITERTVRFHLEQISQRSVTSPSRWDTNIRMMIDGALKLRGSHSLIREKVS